MISLTKKIACSGIALMLMAAAAHAQGGVTATTQGVTGSEIVLGMHTDLSGPAAAYGVPVVNAFRMMLDEVNAAGGIHGRKIDLRVEDTGYQVPRAVQASQKLLKRDKIFAMVGAAGTQTNNAVLPMLEDAGISNIFPISWSDSMSSPATPLKFALYAPYSVQIQAGVRHLVERGRKNVCAMYQDTDYGHEILQGVERELEELGMSLVASVNHKPTDQDFTVSIAKLKDAGCDLVAMGTIVRDTILPYSYARSIGWTDVDFVGTSGTYSLSVSEADGGLTDGFYSVGFFDAPYADHAEGDAADWIAAYTARYNEAPTITSAIGQVAMDIVLHAIEDAGPNLTAEKFLASLEGLSGFKDIFGGPEQSFSQDRHYSAEELNLYKVDNGRWIRVDDGTN